MLDCEHLSIVNVLRKETVLIFRKYHLQKKQTDTEQNNEKLMTSLELIKDGSHTRQRN
ncbi:11558_t:CDS:2 [Funneliformis mosseae]|uniref:11558_t:CDS:1 n=1 Tax=Funneliformis mosseae TaxID=27381 RepID=A0A9N9FX38_FUNMO|nr:11558_t:CDS:2 [Funneliformis mosseae]